MSHNGFLRGYYDRIHAQLTAAAGEPELFLNLGFAADDAAADADRPQPRAARLVQELIGDTDLDGCRILDVGCGRGGACREIARRSRPALLVGVDLSRLAVQFCRQAHRYDYARFIAGDAESLPLATAAVDVVLNLESSHCYQHLDTFYREVRRVLRPGGLFLYGDVLPRPRSDAALRQLQRLGFAVIRSRDVTANVARSVVADGAARRDVFTGTVARLLDQSWATAAATLQSGTVVFRLLALRTPPV
jgi:phthiocerol/phenolphthiocerol synthesis type-I polyketide synthase E